jgi:hypothetical protein
MFHGGALNDAYGPFDLDNPMNDPTLDPALLPRKPSLGNDNHNDHVELKMEDKYQELNDRTTGRLDGSLPTPQLGYLRSLASIPTLG